jgi:hypothetical protein
LVVTLAVEWAGMMVGKWVAALVDYLVQSSVVEKVAQTVVSLAGE